METLTENEIADIKDYADELETELNHRTLQWEGVKDMLGTAQAELAELKAKNKRLREVLKDAKPIYAISSNTASVRKGYEMGGYVKHYVIEPHVMNEALGRNR